MFRDGSVTSYKRGATGSNPVAPTRSEGMLGGRSAHGEPSEESYRSQDSHAGSH
jgi:hypothetical protein